MIASTLALTFSPGRSRNPVQVHNRTSSSIPPPYSRRAASISAQSPDPPRSPTASSGISFTTFGRSMATTRSLGYNSDDDDDGDTRDMIPARRETAPLLVDDGADSSKETDTPTRTPQPQSSTGGRQPQRPLPRLNMGPFGHLANSGNSLNGLPLPATTPVPSSSLQYHNLHPDPNSHDRSAIKRAGDLAKHVSLTLPRIILAIAWFCMYCVFVGGSIVYLVWWGLLQLVTGFARAEADREMVRRDLGGFFDKLLDLFEMIW